MTTIGKKIKDMRQSKNMSQEELAFELSVTRQTVSKWEQGTAQPSADNIMALCDVFDVDADFLLNETPRDSETVATSENSAGEKTALEPKSETKPTKKRTGMILAIIIVSIVVFVICAVVCGIAIYIAVEVPDEAVIEKVDSHVFSWGEIICGCAAFAAFVTAVVLIIYYAISNKKHKK